MTITDRMENLENKDSSRSTEPSQAFSENKTLSSIEGNTGLSAYRRCNSRNSIASDEILLSDLECGYGLQDHLTGCSRDLDEYLRKDKLSPRQKNSEVLRAVDQDLIKISKFKDLLGRTHQKHLANYICYSCFTKRMSVEDLKGDWPINRMVVEIFNKNRPMLVTDLHPDSLLDRLLAENVISILYLESVRSKTKTSDMNRELIDIVTRRSTRDVQQFLECLKKHHGLVYIALFGSIQEAGLPLEIVLVKELYVRCKVKESDDISEETAKENKKKEGDVVETAANQTGGRESIPQRTTFDMMTETEKEQLYEAIARKLHNMGDVFVNNEIDREMERKVHDKLAKLEETRKGWFRATVDSVIGPALVSGIMKIAYDAL